MIDRSLNYGRHLIKNFLKSAGRYQTVLDIGAGCGDDLMIARMINQKAILHAIEVSSENKQILARNNITLHSVNIEKALLPFCNESVDIIIANQVLEHTKEIFWIFHEITRILRVGGKIIIGVPNLASLHNRVLLALGKQPSSLKTASAHIRGFTKKDIVEFVDGCFYGGYKLNAFGGSNFYPFPPFIAKPLAVLFPTMAWGIFFMLEKQRAYNKDFLDFPETMRLETNFYRGEIGS
ncbi:MAG: class I SAM-dependent methyltransferase [Candidatus Brocadiaceae bacterium]|nr:class I SAM-dependent methyltransferase [Candidatus Brocadiaceae bacterium]